IHQRFDVTEAGPREPRGLKLHRGGSLPIVALQGPARGSGRKGIGCRELVLVEPRDSGQLRQQPLSALVFRLLEVGVDQVIDSVELIECPAASVQSLACAMADRAAAVLETIESSQSPSRVKM